MNSPSIGSSARGSRSGRPIMVALDALGRRGALRLLWELRNGPLTFRALQTACDTNPGSLNTRLKELRQLCIVDHADAGYFLTAHGHSLMTALEPLQTWAHRWAADALGAARVPSHLSHESLGETAHAICPPPSDFSVTSGTETRAKVARRRAKGQVVPRR